MDSTLKPNGRIFKVIKYMPLGYEQYVKYDSLDKVGDIFKERKDGWFKNIRNGTGANILNFENYEEYYEEIKESIMKQEDEKIVDIIIEDLELYSCEITMEDIKLIAHKYHEKKLSLRNI